MNNTIPPGSGLHFNTLQLRLIQLESLGIEYHRFNFMEFLCICVLPSGGKQWAATVHCF